ncbi:MAG: NAD(P)/FAD-dependent oxidoreductase, partial [Acidimicrobiia bacterium]
APVDVTLIDRTNHHVFQPLLYQVATGILSEGSIAPATRDVLRKHSNVTVELGDVVGFDLAAQTVEVARPGNTRDTLGYDSLIVAAGVSQSYFGHDEFAEHAPGMKTLADAVAQRERILGAFERAELESDAEIRHEWLTFAVVGGGPTGVEIAGQIAEMSRRALTNNFRRSDPSEVRVVLFEGGEEILATFGDRLSRHGSRELERTGVEIQTSSIVTGVDADGVDFKGPDGSIQRLAAKTVIWAAGVQASPLAAMLSEESGAEVDRAGRIKVLPDCTLPGHPEVFAIGDMMALNGLPGVAEVAMQTGIHSARTIIHRLDDEKEPVAFVYRDLGSMAAISRRRAIVSFHGVRVWGFVGWLMWLFVHLTFLTGFRNRFVATISWFLSFLGHGRNERAIVDRWAVESEKASRKDTSVEIE